MLCFAPIGTVSAGNDAGVHLASISQEVLAKKIIQKQERKILFSLVDLRLEGEYQSGHLPGAVNAPLKKLRFLAESMFAKNDEIIFYGYSREDRASVNAMILLGNKGFKHISLLDGGFEEWKGKVE